MILISTFIIFYTSFIFSKTSSTICAIKLPIDPKNIDLQKDRPSQQLISPQNKT